MGVHVVEVIAGAEFVARLVARPDGGSLVPWPSSGVARADASTSPTTSSDRSLPWARPVQDWIVEPTTTSGIDDELTPLSTAEQEAQSPSPMPSASVWSLTPGIDEPLAAHNPFEGQRTDVDLLASVSAKDLVEVTTQQSSEATDTPPVPHHVAIVEAVDGSGLAADLLDAAWPDGDGASHWQDLRTELFSPRALPDPSSWPPHMTTTSTERPDIGASFAVSARGVSTPNRLVWPTAGTKRRAGVGRGLLRTHTPGAFIVDVGHPSSRDPSRDDSDGDELFEDGPDGVNDDDVLGCDEVEAHDPFESRATDPALRLEALVARQLRASRQDSAVVEDTEDFWLVAAPPLDAADKDVVDCAPLTTTPHTEAPALRVVATAEITSDELRRPRRIADFVKTLGSSSGTDSGEGEIGGP